MPTFGKGLDLRRTAEETFEVKDVLNSTLDSETLKQTLYRQAKNQVGTYQSLPRPPPGWMAGPSHASPTRDRLPSLCGHPMSAWGTPRTLALPCPLLWLERPPNDSLSLKARVGRG